MKAAILASALATSVANLPMPALADDGLEMRTYHQAWKIVGSTFYDKTMNGQDRAGWAKWKHRYDDQLHTREDCAMAIRTMIASLGDPCTQYIEKRVFDELEIMN